MLNPSKKEIYCSNDNNPQAATGKMRIQLKSLTGDIYNIQNAQTWETIGDLKLKVRQTYGIHVEEQKLIVAHLSSGDFVPADTAMLSQLEIVDGVVVVVVVFIILLGRSQQTSLLQGTLGEI